MSASKQKFKVGDRVSASGTIDHRTFKNAVGTIAAIDENLWLEVAFDTWNNGHDGSQGDSKIHNRWYIEPRNYKQVTVIKDALVAAISNPIVSASNLLPHDAKERKEIPLASGVLDYFTSALLEVAKVSFKGNEQHNPGEPLHWSQEKSTDHADTLLRHFVERGTLDTDGQRHSAKVAWRALALLQMELQNEGYPKARGAK